MIAEYSYHAFMTDRAGAPIELDAWHRAHANCENAIRDLKYGVGLNHLPSGRFGANAAWRTLNVIAHNLSRWTARIDGLGAFLLPGCRFAGLLRSRSQGVSGSRHEAKGVRSRSRPRGPRPSTSRSMD